MAPPTLQMIIWSQNHVCLRYLYLFQNQEMQRMRTFHMCPGLMGGMTETDSVAAKHGEKDKKNIAGSGGKENINSSGNAEGKILRE